ncbi:MAG TPA: HAD family hydrolase [Nanoarchaeota archaeon]|nr:HAD family hydrolase [Nanoarchaeota archaeon]
MNKIKVISFDMDGCLTDEEFNNRFYFVALPSVFAKMKGIPFREAHDFARGEYKKLYGNREWADPAYWLKHFGIQEPLHEFIKDLKKHIRHYKDTTPVLKSLRQDYRLVVVSASPRHMIDLKLAEESISQYFEATFSMHNDFNTMKKEPEAYKEICKKLGIKPDEMVHVGDSRAHDYENPEKAGIKSFLLDREGVEKHDFVVKSLYEFEKKVRALG